MWDEYLYFYGEALNARHLAPGTVTNQLRSLRDFAAGLGRSSDPRNAKLDDILNYRARLGRTDLAITTQNTKVRHVKAFYKWLYDTGRSLTDPGKNLPVLKAPKSLPRNVPGASQVVKLLRVPNVTTPIGIRDRAMLELLYSSGLRAGELCKLTIYDLDTDKKTLRILQAKGRKDRIVPVGRVAIDWCDKYLKEVRPVLLPRGKPGHGDKLFLTMFGGVMRSEYLNQITQRCAKTAGLPTGTTPHSLRHACGTEMLKGGATVKHVQEMLGHADITTTQIYTHLAKADLQAVHRKTAPSERRKMKEAPKFTMTNWRPRKRKKPRRRSRKSKPAK